jgi:DNA mismatch repair protein MutS
MSITRDYFAIQKYFEQKYGENSIVLVQVGAFYECYEYNPEYNDTILANESQGNVALKFSLKSGKADGFINGETVNVTEKIKDDECIGHALDLSLILNMKLTSKNKEKPHSITNPMMCGFPCPAYEIHRDLILYHGFTIVRIDQKDKNADGDNVERHVVEISSPGTEIDNNNILQATCTNTIVSIYIDCQKFKQNMDNNVILCGLSCIDVSTGRNIVCEVYSKENDQTYAIHEISRFLIVQKPIELILHVNNVLPEKIDDYMMYLNDALELDHYMVKIIKFNQLDPNYLNDQYQENIFQKAFVESSLKPINCSILQPGTSNIIYQLDLENFTYGRISYTVLLQYCYEHNENIIKKLQKPQISWTDENKHLILAHNSMLQLDIFPKSNVGYLKRRVKIFDSLISVVDMTSNPIGTRYLRRQLLNPITDCEKLESIYAMTDELMHDEELLKFVDSSLRRIPDLEKYQRKIQIGLIRPKEFVNLFRGYDIIQQLYIILFQKCFSENGDKVYLRNLFMSESDINDFNECLKETWEMVNIDKLDRVKFNSRIGSRQLQMQCDESFINPNKDPEIDQIQQALQHYQHLIHVISEHLNSVLTGRVKKIELVFERNKVEDENSGMTVCLYATSATARQLRNAQINQELCGALVFHEVNKTKTIVTSEIIRQCCQGIENYQTLLEYRLLIKFNELVNKIGKRTYFAGLNNFIGTLDFLKSNSQVAIKYKYFRPKIDTSAKNPFISIVNARHPLIERIIRSEYISNDVNLGSDENSNGLLLFGVNSTGKTSLAKMLACILLAAQSGMYVPGELTYKPFNKIITRLSGEDDLLKGKSSFVVEMIELRTILRGADKNTLVLGDELCRGTESVSGTSLTTATIQTLINRNTKFIFSTHMHHLPEIPIIKNFQEQGKLQISHLTAIYDSKLDRLVYNRRLDKGSGSSEYGLEVCKSLNIDKDFIDLANDIRKDLGNIPSLFHNTKKSRYSNKIYVDKCSFCSVSLNLQTHHIKEQNEADERGFINFYHKNSPFNLLVLCDTCHKQLHLTNNQLVRKETLEGIFIEPVCSGKIM